MKINDLSKAYKNLVRAQESYCTAIIFFLDHKCIKKKEPWQVSKNLQTNQDNNWIQKAFDVFDWCSWNSLLFSLLFWQVIVL